MGVVVPLDERREPSESLAPLPEIVNEDMNAINRIILDGGDLGTSTMIPELAHHLIDSGASGFGQCWRSQPPSCANTKATGHVRTAGRHRVHAYGDLCTMTSSTRAIPGAAARPHASSGATRRPRSRGRLPPRPGISACWSMLARCRCSRSFRTPPPPSPRAR